MMSRIKMQAVGTAVPHYALEQGEIREFAAHIFRSQGALPLY